MDMLRGRSAVSPQASTDLPLTHAKPWRHGRPPLRHGHCHPHSHQRGGWHCGGWASRRVVHRVLLALLALVVVTRLGTHLFGGPQPDLADLMRLNGDGPTVQPAAWRPDAETAAAQQPKLIPRIIHQTHAGGALPPRLRQYMASWRQLNPGWEVRLYTDQVRQGRAGRQLGVSLFAALPAKDWQLHSRLPAFISPSGEMQRSAPPLLLPCTHAEPCCCCRRCRRLLSTRQDCLDFVRHEFPDYLEAYRRLGRGVERADFFR